MNEVWHDVIDLQLWKMTSITDECFDNDNSGRYMNSADVEGLIYEVERLREGIKEMISELRKGYQPVYKPIRKKLKEMIEGVDISN